MKAYKLFRVLKDGSISSLFINKKERYPINKWITAKSYPTKGYTIRPYWHCTSKPIAPHLSMKGRSWFEVEMKNYTEMNRPKNQGGLWFLSQEIKIIKQIPLKSNGYQTPCCQNEIPEWEYTKYKGHNGKYYPKIISHNKKIGELVLMNFNGEYLSYDWTEIHYCNKCKVEYEFLNSSI
jgi:hypothetical protein